MGSLIGIGYRNGGRVQGGQVKVALKQDFDGITVEKGDGRAR